MVHLSSTFIDKLTTVVSRRNSRGLTLLAVPSVVSVASERFWSNRSTGPWSLPAPINLDKWVGGQAEPRALWFSTAEADLRVCLLRKLMQNELMLKHCHLHCRQGNPNTTNSLWAALNTAWDHTAWKHKANLNQKPRIFKNLTLMSKYWFHWESLYESGSDRNF